MVNPLIMSSLGATGVKALSEFLIAHPGCRQYWQWARFPTYAGSLLGGVGGFVAGVKKFGERHFTSNPNMEMATTDGITMIGMNPLAAATSGAMIGFSLPFIAISVAGIEAHSRYIGQGSWTNQRYKNIFPAGSYWDQIWQHKSVSKP